MSANAGGVEYLYDAQNKRVWQGNFSGGVLTTQSVTLFGADGKMLNTYGIAQVGTAVSFTGGALRAYFGGKLVGRLQASGLMVAVVQDRLGSAGILSLWRGAECAAVGERSGEVCDVHQGCGDGE